MRDAKRSGTLLTNSRKRKTKKGNRDNEIGILSIFITLNIIS